MVQAQRLAEDLLPLDIDLIISSPYLRARQTVAKFSQAADLAVALHDDLRERKLTSKFVEDFPSLIQKAWANLDFALPNCESGLACQARMMTLLQELIEKNRGRTLLLSTHGNAIALLMYCIDDTYGSEFWNKLTNPDLIQIVARDSKYEIRSKMLDSDYLS